MRYMLLMYAAESGYSDVERTACMVESLGVCDELTANGQFVDSSPLQPVSTAISVRVRNGETLVTAGPFAETAEQLGGYYVLDLPDLDAAIAVAARLPPARKGTVEIRPMFALDGVPAGRPSADAAGSPLTPYLLLSYDDEAAWQAAGPAAHRAAKDEAAALSREVHAAGRLLSVSPLHPADRATCVRVRGGRREVTDGPFAETHEVLGGYYLVLAESPEEAVRIAARHPGARVGSVEVRPLFDLSSVRKRRAA